MSRKEIRHYLSENDIREYVKRRKISGGTRSRARRRSGDTITSLKKIYRKLGISFRPYLKDRLERAQLIPTFIEKLHEIASIGSPHRLATGLSQIKNGLPPLNEDCLGWEL
jgi:hypothetical protein